MGLAMLDPYYFCRILKFDIPSIYVLIIMDILDQFRKSHPMGCLISEVVQVFKNEFVVRVTVIVDGVTRATGMAGAERVDVAEDMARVRALAVLGIGGVAVMEVVKPKVILDIAAKALPSASSTYVPGVDLSDLIAQTDVEIQRLGWTTEMGKDYLARAYGKSARSMLSDPQLRDFLQFLKGQSKADSYNVG
jgi:hypothetical protein